MMKILACTLIFSILLVSCQNNFYNAEDYSSVLKIDSHIHLNSDKGCFEDQAMKDNFRLITINVDYPPYPSVKQQHDTAILLTKKYPGKVFYVASFHFDTAGRGTVDWSRNVISDIKNAISSGAKSVKLWRNIGMNVKDKNGKFIMVDDPAIEPVIDFIISRNLPVTAHIGDPPNRWPPLAEFDSSNHESHPRDHPSYEDLMNARDHLIENHPDLKFIGCHLGSLEWTVHSLGKTLDKFPNMVVDISLTLFRLQYLSAQDRRKARDFCIKYQDRLLYGTDVDDNKCTSDPEGCRKKMHERWLDDWLYFATKTEMTSTRFEGKFEGLQLPKKVVDKIFRENAIKWYKLEIQ